jgi:adenylylsulfate reductase subunit B
MPVKIDYHRCIGCKRCYELCPMDVYTWDKEMDMPRTEHENECWHCGICYMECPKRCIDVTLPVSLM